MTNDIQADATGDKTLATWGRRSTFSYRRAEGLHLSYGNRRQLRIRTESLERLFAALHEASDKDVLAVFGPAPSLDAIALATVTQTRIASYLAPVLVDLGLAERSGDGLVIKA